MSEQQNVYLEFTGDIPELFRDFDLTPQEFVKQALARQGVQIKDIRLADMPGGATRGTGLEMDLANLIIAGSAGAVSMAAAVKIIVGAINDALNQKIRRNPEVKFTTPEVVRDAAGNPVMENGKVKIIHKPVTPDLSPEPALSSVKVHLKDGIIIQWGSNKKD
ncbi:MAG: hypothetical protein GY862_10585 [Gammaproteobacteria bacterium]|nr:hypothetical protein [Gammaproteobacteria bacterium]